MRWLAGPTILLMFFPVVSLAGIHEPAVASGEMLELHGSVVLKGPMSAMEGVEWNEGSREHTFSLTGTSLTVRAFESSMTLGPDEANADDPSTTVNTTELGPVVVTATSHETWHFLRAHAFGRGSEIAFSGSCLQATASRLTEVQFLSLVAKPDEPDYRTTIGLSNAVEVDSCVQGVQVSIQGDFVVSLWEWDATIASDEGSTLLTTGRENLIQSPVELPTLASRDRYALLYVTNGTLSMPYWEGADYWIAGASAATVAGTAEFVGRGQVTVPGNEEPAQGHSIVIRGQLGLDLRRDELDMMRADVAGELAHIEADGRVVPLAITSAVPVEGGFSGSLIWFAGAALATLLAMYAGRRRLSAWLLRRAATHTKAYRHRLARVTCRSALLLHETAQGLVLQGYLESRRGKLGRALARHQRADGLLEGTGQRSLIVQNSLEAAQACHELRRTQQEVLDWLDAARCADAGATFAQLALADRAQLRPYMVQLLGAGTAYS